MTINLMGPPFLPPLQATLYTSQVDGAPLGAWRPLSLSQVWGILLETLRQILEISAVTLVL